MAIAVVATDLLVQFGLLASVTISETLERPLRHVLFLAVLMAVVTAFGWAVGVAIRSILPIRRDLRGCSPNARCGWRSWLVSQVCWRTESCGKRWLASFQADPVASRGWHHWAMVIYETDLLCSISIRMRPPVAYFQSRLPASASGACFGARCSTISVFRRGSELTD